MMKKLLLMSALAAVGTMSASAQSARSSKATGQNQQLVNTTKPAASFLTPTGEILGDKGGRGSEKPTAGGNRWYSYAEYVSKLTPLDDSTQFPYFWHKGTAKGIYSDGSGGLVADTIRLASMAISFDPAFRSSTTTPTFLEGFNDPAAGYDESNIVVRRSNAYVVDSVRLWGIYGRNSSKTAVVDTVRFAIVYGGADMPVYNFNDGGDKTKFPYTAFGYDTVKFASIGYDKVNGIAKGATRVIKDLYLTSADTSLSFVRDFAVAVNLNVPAGNVVGVSANFISGDASFIPFVDTVFYGSLNPAQPFKFGMIRPRTFSEPPAAFTKSGPGYPQYQPGYYNTGFVKNLPESASWDDMYVPSYAYTAPFSDELPDIDVKVSCSSCNTIKELAILEPTVFESVKAYPNPANTEINIPVVVREKATVTFTIVNMIGQMITTQNMGTVNAGQQTVAKFNTSNLANGVYMYTVQANGQRVSNRFSVAH